MISRHSVSNIRQILLNLNYFWKFQLYFLSNVSFLIKKSKKSIENFTKILYNIINIASHKKTKGEKIKCQINCWVRAKKKHTYCFVQFSHQQLDKMREGGSSMKGKKTFRTAFMIAVAAAMAVLLLLLRLRLLFLRQKKVPPRVAKPRQTPIPM